MAGWTRWFGLGVIAVGLLAGDQIRLKRPDHKYRLTVEIETPDGMKSASGVIAVHPNRSYAGTGSTGTQIKGDALVVDAGKGKGVVVLLAHGGAPLDLEAINYIDLRAINAATGQRVQFRELKSLSASAPVTEGRTPVLLAFADMANPASARVVRPDEFETSLGGGIRLKAMTVETLPPGWWPIDFGGALGEPVTRQIDGKLPWWRDAETAAARALQSAMLSLPDGTPAIKVFRR
ncbi:MAG: hypothetical protein A4S14_18915 [Proteobacteria bacterium SG_bin9]|nr:MAG: hypothetical protein A4S14_18915 [Proteobacteria bacterium SG_bin9]